MNEVFKPVENMRINTRNSFLNRKTSTRQKGLSYIGPAIWNRIAECFKKTRNLNTFNIRWNSTILMISLIQIYEMLVDFIMLWPSWKIFFSSLNKYFCIFFFLIPASLWLKYHMKIRLFDCFVLYLPYCFSSL